jgi:hypothetical protein
LSPEKRWTRKSFKGSTDGLCRFDQLRLYGGLANWDRPTRRVRVEDSYPTAPPTTGKQEDLDIGPCVQERPYPLAEDSTVVASAGAQTTKKLQIIRKDEEDLVFLSKRWKVTGCTSSWRPGALSA